MGGRASLRGGVLALIPAGAMAPGTQRDAAHGMRGPRLFALKREVWYNDRDALSRVQNL